MFMYISELASADDAKFIADIYRSEISEIDSPEDRTTELGRVDDIVSEELGELGDNRAIFLGFDGARPVGVVQLLLKSADDDLDLANGSDTAHVHHLIVVHDRRKSGLGKILMAEVERYAKEHGIYKITLGVDNWNENAIGFYEHLGYKPFKQADGRTSEEKVIYMSKILNRM
jgi:ribosomal protein S18 acetylase RimI-like enzyme